MTSERARACHVRDEFVAHGEAASLYGNTASLTRDCKYDRAITFRQIVAEAHNDLSLSVDPSFTALQTNFSIHAANDL